MLSVSPRATRFSTDVIWNVVSLAVLGMAGIVINVVVGRFLGAEALGVYNQVFACYIFLSQLSVGGIHFSVLAHVSRHPHDREANSIITVSALVLAGGFSALFAVLTLAGRGLAGALLHSPGVTFGLGLAAPGLIALAMNKVLMNVLNGIGSMQAYAVFQALRFLLIFVGVLTVCLLAIPGVYLPVSLTFAEVILLITLVWYIHVRVVPLLPVKMSRVWIREHLSFGMRGFLSGALAEINTRIDVLCLGYFTTDRTVGIYSMAAILAEGVSQLSLVIRRNVDPLLGKSFAAGETGQIERQARKIQRVFSPLMLAVGVVSVALYPTVLRLAVDNPVFEASSGVFIILMVGVVLNAVYRPFLGILLQGGRPGMHTLLVATLVLVNTAGNVLLIPLLGMYGAAVATAFVLFLEAVLVFVSARWLFGVRL